MQVLQKVFLKGDVEDAGTFGDFLGGPTESKRDSEDDPGAELLNRLKFGIEGGVYWSVWCCW